MQEMNFLHFFFDFIWKFEIIVVSLYQQIKTKTFMKLSELNYDKVCSMLNKNNFSMHYDASDCLRDIYTEKGFEEVKSQIMGRYGDVEISVNPGSYWWNEVKIEDKKWNDDMDVFNKEKQAWCSKYGCD